MNQHLGMGYPGDRCCTLWDRYKFNGESATICMENSEFTAIDLKALGAAKMASSWWCGASIAY